MLLHGVPASSFLYRKVIPRLADQGLRAIALDFPGLGLADRPAGFDYCWSGLARWLGEAIDALELDRCHLVVHDIGGPIGCEWAIRNPERVLSLTALNTDLDPATFRRPWSMPPFATRGLGAAWLHGTPRPAFAALPRPGARRPRRDHDRRDLRLPLPADAGSTAAARSCGSCAASSSRTRSTGSSGPACQAPLPGQDDLGRARPGARPRPPRDRAAGARRRRRDPAAGQALPPGGPSARSPRRSPTSRPLG